MTGYPLYVVYQDGALCAAFLFEVEAEEFLDTSRRNWPNYKFTLKVKNGCILTENDNEH
jgi:hypothetical protein